MQIRNLRQFYCELDDYNGATLAEQPDGQWELTVDMPLTVRDFASLRNLLSTAISVLDPDAAPLSLAELEDSE